MEKQTGPWEGACLVLEGSVLALSLVSDLCILVEKLTGRWDTGLKRD